MGVEKEALLELRENFSSCSQIFVAMGDTCRQQLLLDIMTAGQNGANVSDLASKSHLSRPAISHHLKVLKDSGLIDFEKKGTQMFYRLTIGPHLNSIESLVHNLQRIIPEIRESGMVALAD